jgi:hypothetical protein
MQWESKCVCLIRFDSVQKNSRVSPGRVFYKKTPEFTEYNFLLLMIKKYLFLYFPL